MKKKIKKNKKNKKIKNKKRPDELFRLMKGKYPFYDPVTGSFFSTIKRR